MSVILLSGGTSLRMGSPLPKQYLRLHGKVIAKYSFDLFLNQTNAAELIVVCAPEYQHFFEIKTTPEIPIKFALPGLRRQDSVFNGLQAIDPKIPYVCIHDAARPFLSEQIIERTLDAAIEFGAATTAMPIKFTIKEADEKKIVKRTPDRASLWEIQTPQILRRELLETGFAYAIENQITVTDDVSLAELLSQPVKLIEGDERNIKITTPLDLKIAEALQEHHSYNLA